MIWYGLTNEYMKMDNGPAAIESPRNVIRIKPVYTSAYQMLGSALVKQEGREEARRIWMEGIKAANGAARGRLGGIWKRCSPV